MSENLQCPVSFNKVDETVVRLIALQIVLISIVGALFDNPYVFLFLFLDFSLRSLTSGKFSLLKQIGISFSKLFQMKKRLIAAEPKKFAALLGAIFSIVIAILFFLDFDKAALFTVAMLTACALLESFLAVCIGCYVYTLLTKMKLITNY